MSDLTFADAARVIRRKGVSAVSFALFGSFLLRRCLNSESVYEQTLRHAPVPERLRQIPESFVQHRNLAGNRLSFDRVHAKGNPPFSIAEIYDQFAVHPLGLTAEVRPALAEAELKANQDLALVNPVMRALYQQARALGRRVGIAADSVWSAEQIRAILAVAAPDMSFDFIYSASDAECRDNGGLFRYLLQAEGLKKSQLVHIGQDEDFYPLPTAGVTVIPYILPQDPWEAHYEREEAAARLLSVSDRVFDWRLDNGLRLARRLVMADLQLAEPQQQVAAAVLGPVMCGFNHHIARRAVELSGPGRTVKVLFLARDAYLSHRVWTQAAEDEAEAVYIELNRRIAIIAGSEGEEGYKTLCALFENMSAVSAISIEQFFKIKLSPKIQAIFAAAPQGLISGPDFARRLPQMVGGRARLKALADNLRDAMIEYLVAKLGPLEDLTDLLLVDVGYTGNIQRALRRVFDRMGLHIRLHGDYLMPHGEAFVDLPPGDSLCGYLDEMVLTPAVKRAIMRDGPLIEEFCCAPVGSTRGYVDGREIRETDVRLPHEIAFCMEMQEDALRFISAFRQTLTKLGVDPLVDFDRYRAWTAAILARFVMMPTGLECQTFGPLMHDVSLGSKGLIATITTADIRNLMGALAFPAVASITHPPVWLGGSMMSYSAMAGFSYAMSGLGLPTSEMLTDVAVGQVEAILLKGEQGTPVPASMMLTPFGDVRLRIPVLARDKGCLMAVPLAPQFQRGVIRSLVLQGGIDANDATTTRDGVPMQDEVKGLRAVLDGNYYRATEPDAFLLLQVPDFTEAIGLVNLLITPLFE